MTPPGRGAAVLVRGLLTRRRWLRNPDQVLAKEEWKDTFLSGLFEPELRTGLSVGDRQALAALRSAIGQTDQLARVQSLWQAIEAYAGETRMEKMFSKRERKYLAESIPDEFSDAQHARLTDVYRGLNNRPLMARLRWRLEEERVPVSVGEMELLDYLRRVRNAVTHGREPERMPGRDEIEHAISVVSRMLVFRVAADRRSAG
jgi:hypothetical protein